MPVKPRLRNVRMQRRSIPLPYQETDPRALWEDYEPGKEITPSNLVRDALESTSYDPTEIIPNFTSRLRKYLTQGPDINQPVPLTERRYQSRRF